MLQKMENTSNLPDEFVLNREMWKQLVYHLQTRLKEEERGQPSVSERLAPIQPRG